MQVRIPYFVLSSRIRYRLSDINLLIVLRASDISTALQVLEQIHATVETSNNEKLKASTKDDLHLLITTLQNPILRSIATIQVRRMKC